VIGAGTPVIVTRCPVISIRGRIEITHARAISIRGRIEITRA
jgi:hypothetical protein